MTQQPPPTDAPGPSPSWLPPAGEPWPAYPPPGAGPVAPPPPTSHVAPARGRVSGWIWPVVASTALVVGVIGGVAGSVAYEALRDDPADNPGTVDGGLDGVDIESLPPLSVDDGSVAAVAEQLLPSTVQISAQYEGVEGGATGSGFVLTGRATS